MRSASAAAAAATGSSAGSSSAATSSAPACSVGEAASCCCSFARRSSASACALRCAHLASSVALRDLASIAAGSESLARLAVRDPSALLYRSRTATTKVVPTSRLRGLHVAAEARRGGMRCTACPRHKKSSQGAVSSDSRVS
eukprot:scaffold49769_cov54-Phaeocystis_antarctica.AAC.3